jgi:DNA polymerase-4
VAWRLRREGLKGRTITLKIKFDDFSEMSKSHTIDYPTDSTKIISDSAIELLFNDPLKRKVRLIGVAVSKLKESGEGYQMDLFEDWHAQEKERRVDETMDEIKMRFGKRMIRKGRG